MVSAERFELSTNGLKGRCSAIELRARVCPDKDKAKGILSREYHNVNVIFSTHMASTLPGGTNV